MKFAFLSLCLLLAQPSIQDDRLTITEDDKEVMSVNRKDFEAEFLGEPFVNHSKIQQLIDRLDEQIGREPVNAKIGDSGEIIPGEDGTRVYQKKFMEKFYEYLYANEASSISVPKLAVRPEVDSELLANIRTQQIGQYVTYFNSNNKERSHNIRLAAEALDSHVVFPGEVFSFNKAVGKRTKEKGYMNAPEIVKGELTEGIGGGICQLSSTLFNSVDKVGVKILERFSHSKRVPYVPPGRDATVSWYGPDFTFKNQFNQPLLIRSRVDGGQVSVTIYSSDVINYDPQKMAEAREGDISV
ncbi:VanW family protein [Halobacillus sp. A5]|uniref:VanW family protein n=1 Tax=Halobacillus sp. A5 TaxID=2880263 RepID=UPI0020A68C7F|nr:VanW family protein [Halobacillus sp. A5]MCP3028626.1 VanW family protein [Halobacillus sp. A5]